MKKIIVPALIFFSACSPRNIAISNTSTTKPVTIDGKLYATLFQQQAAEYRALCLQAFNIARLRLDAYQARTNKPRAIITDIDETILDNSMYEAHQTLQGKDYESAAWLDWTGRAVADTVPGGAAFLKYAASKGVEIFYITNRYEKERTGTLKNLLRFNLPDADDTHLLPRQDTASKELRRQTVAEKHEIIMLLGDNLADFSNLFDRKQREERLQNTNASSENFGNRFIVLPNPVYGDWEGALFKYKKLSDAQKDSVIRSALKTY